MRYISFIITAAFAGILAVAGCSERERVLTIAYTNDANGEIRACGCIKNDHGGLGRRATYVEGLRERSSDFLLFDGGDFSGVGVNYGEQKARLIMTAMSYMEYDAVVVGEMDFAQGVDFLLEEVEKATLPVVVANLVDTKTGELVFPPSRQVELPSGLKIGVIGVMGKGMTFPEAVEEGRLRVDGAEAAISKELARLRDVVDFVVVLAHMPTDRARGLAQAVPGIGLVVTGHDPKPSRRKGKYGDAYVLTTGDRGRFIGVGWATLDSDERIVKFMTEIDALTKDYTDHAAIVKLYESYDSEISRQEQIRVAPAAPQGENAKSGYAGARTCRPCHVATHDQWLSTKHAHAFEILESKNREFDRDCTPCHTTGFDEPGGFFSVVDTPELTDVQCEVCHGNSSAHTRTPTIKTPGNARAACTNCHTAEQTPDFVFKTYWPGIAH
jgi:2',3'-cyclic-nucleotide 2'-phosphodiesterase (5'-nucleotidase family)